MDLPHHLIFVFSIIILIATTIFAFYSFITARFKKGAIGRQIMVAGVLVFFVTVLIDDLDLWFYNKDIISGWVLFSIWIMSLLVIIIGSLRTWKGIQKVYDYPLIELAIQIPEAQHHLVGIVILVVSLPVDLVNLIFYQNSSAWLTVIKMSLWSLGFLILALSASVEYRSIESTERYKPKDDTTSLPKEKLSTLRDDIVLTYAFGYVINSFLSSVTPILGTKVIQNTLKSWEEEHPVLFEGFKKKDKCRILISSLITNLDRIYEKERFSIIMDEYSRFLSHLVDLVSKVTTHQSADRILKDSYEKLEKRNLDHPVEANILQLIPPGLLEDKKLGLLSKEQLEKRVRARTIELRQSNRQLKAEIEERKEAEKKLKKSLQEKDVLLKEIHHRVKNNLQVISSLLNLQSKKIDNPEALAAFSESCDRIRTMASIHNQLYRYENLAEIKFGKYIEELTNYLFRSYSLLGSKIDLDITVDDDISLEVGTAIPCGLIINELITNSLKYAFPDRGEGKIELTLREVENGNLKLIVSDNGVGLPSDFSPQNNSTLGMRLVRRLIDQLEGTFSFDNKNGAKFVINFPAE